MNRTGKGLRPWRKGESGNPGGRPKSKRISEALRALLEEIERGQTGAEIVASAIFKQAKKGDLPCAREVADRTEGKAPQPVHHGTVGGEPIAMIVTIERRKPK